MQTKINGATLTNIGRKRTKNEDAAYFNSCEDFTLLMIADGIGGHKKGEVASDMTISIVSNKISNSLSIVSSYILYIISFFLTLGN